MRAIPGFFRGRLTTDTAAPREDEGAVQRTPQRWLGAARWSLSVVRPLCCWEHPLGYWEGTVTHAGATPGGLLGWLTTGTAVP